MKEKVIFSWSGGKDSALAFYRVKKSKKYNVVALVTTLTKGYQRVSMHGVRERLLDEQALSLGVKLEKIFISKKSSNREYESKMKGLLLKYKAQGVRSVIFGDIFLKDLRKYREKKLKILSLRAIFPLWGKSTARLSRDFISAGFKARITCVDLNSLSKDFAGRLYNRFFLNDLPNSVDPCGENGEFHSFTYDGPIFNQKINCKLGKIVVREKRFCFCDLIPHRQSGFQC